MKNINERIKDLKSWLAKNLYDAVIVPSNDPHLALWTDSRYYIQAENQLKGTDYQLQRIPLPSGAGAHAFAQDKLSARNGSWRGTFPQRARRPPYRAHERQYRSPRSRNDAFQRAGAVPHRAIRYQKRKPDGGAKR